MLTRICGIRLIVIQIRPSIDLGHGFKKANTQVFLLPMNFCFSCPKGWGVSCYLLQHISTHSRAFVTFCTLLKIENQSPLISRREGEAKGGSGGYFDWCINKWSITKIVRAFTKVTE